VVWVTSLLLEPSTPPGGMSFDDSKTPVILTKGMDNYMQSKAGCAWLADKFAKKLGDKGVLSVVRSTWNLFIFWILAKIVAESPSGINEDRIATTLGLTFETHDGTCAMQSLIDWKLTLLCRVWSSRLQSMELIPSFMQSFPQK